MGTDFDRSSVLHHNLDKDMPVVEEPACSGTKPSAGYAGPNSSKTKRSSGLLIADVIIHLPNRSLDSLVRVLGTINIRGWQV